MGCVVGRSATVVGAACDSAGGDDVGGSADGAGRLRALNVRPAAFAVTTVVLSASRSWMKPATLTMMSAIATSVAHWVRGPWKRATRPGGAGVVW